jgi:hypothetical protein
MIPGSGSGSALTPITTNSFLACSVIAILAANQFALHLLGLSGGNRESGDLDDDLEALDTHQVYNFTEAAESGATTPFHLPSAGYPITLRASEPSRPVPS